MNEVQLERRKKRALEEGFKIKNLGSEKIFSSFSVLSPSGRTYQVIIRSLKRRVNGCSCPDYQTNLLGTCKHIEAVLAHLSRKVRGRIDATERSAPPTAEIFLSYGEQVEVAVNLPSGFNGEVAALARRYFDDKGILLGDPVQKLPALIDDIARLTPQQAGELRLAPEVRAHAAVLADGEKHRLQRHWFQEEVAAGRRSMEVVGAKLYPYQAEGVMHLAFNGRALLADDMGLGKTIQAIGAAVLLKELRGISRVLVVTPASLKHQWLREIRRFTSLSAEIIGGPSSKRSLLYSTPSFFTLVNYELLLRDQEVFERLAPDLIILDEAQRVKNWRTKTAQTVKRLRSKYAFVLTGTPIENNLDELYSVMQTLDARILGPMWQFNARYYQLERRSSGSYKVLGHKNLEELRRRISPIVLRRLRSEVLQDLPPRVDNNFFVPMTPAQLEPYRDYQSNVAKLLSISNRRPLTPAESKHLMMSLQKMRILCDALELHDPRISDRQKKLTAPKLDELAGVLREQIVDAGRKAVIFSSFEGMIDLAIERVAKPLGIGFVKLAGSVPTNRRGKLLDRFREDPDCRIFFSTDAGGVGLNLQSASLVINLDIPWNPAVLEQRIGRAHRMGQRETVQVVNLVSQGVIEERMLDTLAQKRQIFQAVFSAIDGPDTLVFAKDRGLMARLRGMLSDDRTPAKPGPEESAPAGFIETTTSTPGADTHDGGNGVVVQAGENALETTATRNTDPGATRNTAPGVFPVENLGSLGERLQARLGGRLLLVRSLAGSSGAPPRLLVVVDRDATALVPVVEEVAGSGDGSISSSDIHLFDRAGYENLILLAGDALGLNDLGKEVYRSPALPFSGGTPSDTVAQAARDAREKFTHAGERLRLARLMADGGFLGEAGTPLKQALDAILEGLYGLAGRNSSASTLPSERASMLEIERHLVTPGILPAEDATRIPWLLSLLESQGKAGNSPVDRPLFERMAAVPARLMESGDIYLTDRVL